MGVLLLVAAVVCFVIYGFLGFGWVSADHPAGWLGFGLVFFAASFLVGHAIAYVSQQRAG